MATATSLPEWEIKKIREDGKKLQSFVKRVDQLRSSVTKFAADLKSSESIWEQMAKVIDIETKKNAKDLPEYLRAKAKDMKTWHDDLKQDCCEAMEDLRGMIAEGAVLGSIGKGWEQVGKSILV